MTVGDLIEFLKTQPQDLQVAYQRYSEQVLMESDEICVMECCVARADGWIQSKRPDQASQKYLMFPGN